MHVLYAKIDMANNEKVKIIHLVLATSGLRKMAIKGGYAMRLFVFVLLSGLLVTFFGCRKKLPVYGGVDDRGIRHLTGKRSVRTRRSKKPVVRPIGRILKTATEG